MYRHGQVVRSDRNWGKAIVVFWYLVAVLVTIAAYIMIQRPDILVLGLPR